jgi:predicted aconitase with swiveling domain
LLIVGVSAAAVAAGASGVTFAQQPSGDIIGELANNEGVFIDGKTFKIARGKAKGDPAAQIAKMGAKEVGPGAIVFRYNDKLYMVEAPAPLPAQAMKDFQNNWNVSST